MAWWRLSFVKLHRTTWIGEDLKMIVGAESDAYVTHLSAIETVKYAGSHQIHLVIQEKILGCNFGILHDHYKGCFLSRVTSASTQI